MSISAAFAGNWKKGSHRLRSRQSGGLATGFCWGNDIVTAQRSIFSRLKWWAIGLSAAVVFGLWTLTFSTIASMSGSSTQKAIDVDLAGLVDIYVSGGEAELAARIDDRLALIPQDGSAPHYLLADASGARLAGNLTKWPNLRARLSETGVIALGNGEQAQARATQLAPELRLVVARELGDIAALQRRISLLFLASGLVLMLAVGLIGRAGGKRLSARITRISDAFMHPATSAIAPIGPIGQSSHDDEIDELTHHSSSAIERMKRLVEAHRETSDQIAHEIRTPLMHIDTKLVKALHEDPKGAVAEKLIAARADIRRLVGMLESLLDIAASKARQGDRHGLSEVNLSQLTRRLGDLYSDSAEDSGHLFECRVSPDVIIDGEEMQLTRLVTNLLDNAFKYSPAGSSVLLSLEEGPVLIVQDTGPGIAADKRANIFERFMRGDNSSGTAHGAGLGLALAKVIAERHGLTLRLRDSEIGATFEVRKEDG